VPAERPSAAVVEPQATQYTAQAVAPSPPPTLAVATTGAPGKGFLFVPGLLHTIFAGIGLLVWLSMLVSVDDWLYDTTAYGAYLYGGEAMRDAWTAFYAVGSIHGLLLLFVGIMAIANCNNRKMANLIFGISIANIVTAVAYFAFSIVTGTAYWIPFMLPSVILPILITVGASRNREQTGMPV